MKHGCLSRFRTPPSGKFVSWLALALTALAYVMVGSHLLHPRYIVNDNIINLNFIRSGYPLDYMGVFLTELLHRAYLLQPVVPWYALCLYGMHVISVFLWLTLIWRVFRPWWLALAFSAALFGYYLFFLIELDYTSTSELLCTSSLVWACLEVLERRQGYLRMVGLGLVFTVGMLVRPQGIIGAFAGVLPVALMIAGHCLRERPTRQELIRLMLSVVVFLVPMLLNLAADAAYRQMTLTPQQSAYEAFNEPRGLLHGLSAERQNSLAADTLVLNEAGWTVENAQNFFHWRFLDERIYTPSSLQTLVKGAPEAWHPRRDVIKHVRLMLGSETDLMLLLFCCLPLFLSAVRKHPWLAGCGLLLPIYCVALDSFLSVSLTFRDRTELPFVASFGLLTLVISGYLMNLSDTGHERLKRMAAIASLMLVCYGAVMSVQSLLARQIQETRWGHFARSELAVLNHQYAGSIVLQQSIIGLQLENSEPLEATPLYFHPITMVWDTFSPYFYASLKPLGVKYGYEVIDAMIDNPDAYFVGDVREGGIILDSYTQKHKGHAEIVLVRHLHPGTSLYRFVTTKTVK